jgi:hypothetical protein
MLSTNKLEGTMTATNLRFFNFRQNNSGGSWDFDAANGIGREVWIEASSADEANGRAEAIGLRFNGVALGFDCGCCGDRWNRAAAWEDEEEPVEPWGPGFVHHADGSITKV